MAASEITVQSMTSAGLEVTYGAANADGNFFTNNGRTWLRVKNADTKNHAVLIDSPGACDQGFYHDVTVQVPAHTGSIDSGPFISSRFTDTLGNVNITYIASVGSSTGTVTIATDAALAALTLSEDTKVLTFTIDTVAKNYTIAQAIITKATFLTALNAVLLTAGTASFDTSNHLKVVSSTTGASSTVVASGTASAAIMGATPTEDTGATATPTSVTVAVIKFG